MKKMLNTLFVTTEGAYLHKERETVVVEIEREKVLQLPLLSISNIFCFGRINMSPQFMFACSEASVDIAFFSEYGKFQARVQGPKSGNVLLRREQYRWADSETKSAEIARYIVGAKIANTRCVLQRFIRNSSGDDESLGNITNCVTKLKRTLFKLGKEIELDSVRGREGEAASNYFGVFNDLITQNKSDFVFAGRNRRPPKDRVNALLSFIYAIMLQDCVSACEGVGLDPYVGFLHRDRPGRQSLALDFLEEFRAFLGDRLVLSLINLQQVSGADFEETESGAVLIGDKVKKTVLAAYQKRKQEELLHPVLNEKVKIGLLFYTQAMLMARYIRGDIDYYPAFIWR